MEKYIVIAHPIDFVYKALAGFLEDKGFKCYRLEKDDDVEFRFEDLKPIVFILHSSFSHEKLSQARLIQKYQGITAIFGIDISAQGVITIEEPFNPAKAVHFILNSLEPKV